MFSLCTFMITFICDASSFRQGLWLAVSSCVLFCSTAAVDSPSCAVWVSLWRTVRRQMETTASWSFSSTTSTCPSFTLDPSWPSTSSTFRSVTIWHYGLIICYIIKLWFYSIALWPHQANNPNLTRKDGEMWNISLQGLLHLGVIMIVAVLLHFMYILTIPSDMKLLKNISDWALGVYLYSLTFWLINVKRLQ